MIANLRKHIEVYICVNHTLRECGRARVEHCHIVPHQQNCHPLTQLSHCFLLLLSRLATNLSPKLVESVKGILVPPPEGVHDDGDKRKTLSLAPLAVFAHLGVEGVLHSTVTIPCHLLHQCLL